jgi:hypothetical protein
VVLAGISKWPYAAVAAALEVIPRTLAQVSYNSAVCCLLVLLQYPYTAVPAVISSCFVLSVGSCNTHTNSAGVSTCTI